MVLVPTTKMRPYTCTFKYGYILDPSSLVPRPLYFAGVENEGLVHTVHACTTF